MPMYRAFPVDQTGRIVAPSNDFEAGTDVEAIVRAMQFVDGHAMEIWDAERRVGVIQRRRDD